jgi:Nucleoside-diphosphate-sugar epimerases
LCRGGNIVRIVVTGGSGKGGAWVVRDLREHGHDVLNVDVRHDGSPFGQCLVTDLTDLGQTQDALAGADAIVHFAAIPAPQLRPEGETFRINAISTYNVFAAAVAHRVRRIVWASSETVLGLPFDDPPAFAPIDESIEPRPESSYALSKLAAETMAAQFARRSGIGFVGLRISNIMEPADYALFPSYWGDAQVRKWNLWGYVDARDVAQAARLGLEATTEGAQVAIIAAADTVMTRPSADLMAEVFPTVPLRRPVTGRETLLAIDHARRLLGYEPRHGWADHVSPPNDDGGVH